MAKRANFTRCHRRARTASARRATDSSMNAVAFRLLFPDPRDRVRDSARVVARPVRPSLPAPSPSPTLSLTLLFLVHFKTPHNRDDRDLRALQSRLHSPSCVHIHGCYSTALCSQLIRDARWTQMSIAAYVRERRSSSRDTRRSEYRQPTRVTSSRLSLSATRAHHGIRRQWNGRFAARD